MGPSGFHRDSTGAVRVRGENKYVIQPVTIAAHLILAIAERRKFYLNDRLLLRPQGSWEKATNMPGQASSEAQRAGKGVRSIQQKATDSDAVQNPSVESSVFSDTY